MAQAHYDFSVPIFIRSLGGLKNVLSVAEKLAAGHPDREMGILETKLAPSMFPLLRQVQIACDNAKGVAARLTGKEMISFPDTETTIAELDARIDTVIAYLEGFTPEDFEGAESREVVLAYFPDKHMVGDGYLRAYALPNFFFHVTTAYCIVRMLGGELGKGDFMNGMPFIENEV